METHLQAKATKPLDFFEGSKSYGDTPAEKITIIELSNGCDVLDFEIRNAHWKHEEHNGFKYVGKVIAKTGQKGNPHARGDEYAIWNINSQDGVSFNCWNGTYVNGLKRAVEIFDARTFSKPF